MSLQKISNILNNKTINLNKNLKLWDSYKTVYELGNVHYTGLYGKNDNKYYCSNYTKHREMIIYLKHKITNKDCDIYKLNQWIHFANQKFFNPGYKINQINMDLNISDIRSFTSLLQPSQNMFESIHLSNVNVKYADNLIDFWVKSKEDTNRKVEFDDITVNHKNDYNPDYVCNIVNTLDKYKPNDIKLNLSNINSTSNISETLVYPNFSKLIFGFSWYINSTININYKNCNDIRYFDDNTKFLFFNRNFIYYTDILNNNTLKNIEMFKKNVDWLYDSLPHNELYNKCYHKKLYLKYKEDTKYNKTQFDKFCQDLLKVKNDLNIKFTLYVPKYYDVSYIDINNNLIQYY
jgi:hypothetical protein